MSDTILETKELQTYFYTSRGTVKAVDGVSFNIKAGETLGIVGESGSGKSVTASSVMRLVPDPPGKIVGGSINFKGQDILAKSNEEMRKIRGNEISMIFQEPMTSLNPVYTIGDQIAEVIRLHKGLSEKKAIQEAIKMLEKVGIPSPEQRVHEYPHQMSGGMRQRIMIAMALACDPELLIADEPTTALDVTIQAQILDLMNDLKEEFGTAIMLITHDLGVIAEVADRVAVMYGGRVVEQAEIKEIFYNPQHPYTEGLIKSIPRLEGNKKRLEPIRGTVPDPFNFPKGCKFANRCDYVEDRCLEKEPNLTQSSNTHNVRCFRHEELDFSKQREVK